MSTSATQPGTTTKAGRSGKGLGIAATALAIVIAAGFVFAVNEGNEVNVSGINELSGPAEIAAARHAERVRLSELAAQAAVQPAGSAELARLNELAAQVKAVRPAGSAELARLNDLAAQVKAESHPAFNIEATKMEMARQSYPGTNPETRTSMLSDKLEEQIYVPSIVQPVETEPTELNQPEWDNRMP